MEVATPVKTAAEKAGAFIRSWLPELAVALVVLLYALALGCSSLPKVILPGEDGSCPAGWTLVGEFCVKDDDARPTPTPAPTATPTPAPIATPEPTPSPAPTATPAPPLECPEPAAWDLTCKFEGCETRRDVGNEDRFGAEVREAIVRVLAQNPTIVDGNSIDAENELLWTALVAAELRGLGVCAKGGGKDRLSRDEVGVWRGSRREHFDVCVASGAPAGRCFVGPEIRFLIAFGSPRGGAPSTPADPPPVEPGALCAGTNPDAILWSEHRELAKGMDHWCPVVTGTATLHPDGRYFCASATDKGDRSRCEKYYTEHPRDAAFAPKAGKSYSQSCEIGALGAWLQFDSRDGGIYDPRGNPRETGRVGKDVLQREPDCRPVR